MLITAVIVTRNEERNLRRALESLAGADELLVVDCGSTDATVAIARQCGARVVSEPWRGYAAQKNFAATQAMHDWILSLDADEALSTRLQQDIAALKRAGADCQAYAFPRLAWYLGRWIRHGGWYPDRKVRLYDRRCAEWVGEYVHESVRVSGCTGQLEGDLLHYTCAAVSDHLRTLDRYTSLAAQPRRAAGRRAAVARLLAEPPWTFFVTYVVRRGFLDGGQGLMIAAMAAFYSFVKLAKTWPEFDGDGARDQWPAGL